MKKKLLILLTMICILALAACSKDDNDGNENPTPTEAADTTTPEPTKEPTPEPTKEPTAQPDSRREEKASDGAVMEDAEKEGEDITPDVNGNSDAQTGYIDEPVTGDGPVIIDGPDTFSDYVPDEATQKVIEAFGKYVDGFISDNPEFAETVCIGLSNIDGGEFAEMLMSSTDEDDAEYYIVKYDIQEDSAVAFGPYFSNEGFMFILPVGLFMTASEKEDGTQYGTLYCLEGLEVNVLGDLFIAEDMSTATLNGEVMTPEVAEERLVELFIDKTGDEDYEAIMNSMRYMDAYDLWNVESYDGSRELLRKLFEWEYEELEPDYDPDVVEYTDGVFDELSGEWKLDGGTYASAADGTVTELGDDTYAVLFFNQNYGIMDVTVNSSTIGYEISDQEMSMELKSGETDDGSWYIESSSDDDDRHYMAGMNGDDEVVVQISVAKELGEDYITLYFTRDSQESGVDIID